MNLCLRLARAAILPGRIQGDGAFTNDGLQMFYRVILEPWTGGIKGETPLIPRFKGVSPL